MERVETETSGTEASDEPRWRRWGATAFAEAREHGRPVLLALGTVWSQGAATMQRTTYRDADVVELIERSFVPVRVDADDRPDVAERYGLGGWPTTAFLTPDGRLLGGQTFTGPGEMRALLTRVAEAFEKRRAELLTTPTGAEEDQSFARPRSQPDGPDTVEPWLRSHLLDAYDPDHGGFGRSAKRITEAPLLVALGFRGSAPGPATSSPAGELRAVAAHTLEAAASGELVDQADGGLFRYVARRDWTAPSREKVLPVNAAGLRVFLTGWSVLDDALCQETALQMIRYVRNTLIDRHAVRFASSERATDAPADDGFVDPTCYTAANADMVRSFVQAAEVTGDSSLLEFAVEVLDGLVADAYQRGPGLLHRTTGDDSVSGLLVDQVSVAEALLDAYDATDRDVYLDLAHELMLFALRALWSSEQGVLVDRVVDDHDIGLLRRTITPFAGNCRAAGVLARLGQAAEKPELMAKAQGVLATQRGAARSHSIDAAPYVLARWALEGA